MNSIEDMTSWSFDVSQSLPDQTYKEMMEHLQKIHKEVEEGDVNVEVEKLRANLKHVRQVLHSIASFGFGLVIATVFAKVM